ncbi:glycine betaine transporter OpuD [Geomicrobium sp. JCM 19039]|nr:glycine betaine transporter OpuD [Geomicrobium sp. JCM 19039]
MGGSWHRVNGCGCQHRYGLYARELRLVLYDNYRIFVALSLFLVVSPFGKIRLGSSDDRPEYNYPTWIGMIFAAGIGVGFVFWGVAEPVLYFDDPPDNVVPGTAEAATVGLRYGVFHWSLHVWAIFGLVGLVLAYVQFRKNQPALISSAFTSLMGDKIAGWPAKSINIFAVLATAMGVATTFGLSALQMSGGLSYISNIENNFLTQFTIIGIVTVLFMVSAASGVNRGIKYLSNVNLCSRRCVITLCDYCWTNHLYCQQLC